MMKFDTKEPCANCPYRRDAKLGLWHPREFDNLARTERSQLGSIFACHKTRKDPSVCAGWLLKQRDNGVPSIMLRVAVLDDNSGAYEALESVSDGGHELYDSVQEMIEANEALGRCPDCGRYMSDHGQCPVCKEDD